ncbi:MAG: HipA family kinase [Sediminicola sp.]
MDIRPVTVTRYIAPLREGGSLPAIAEADDGFNYVVKFRGAGHGVKALIAEFLGGEIARLLGLKVPEIVFAELDEAFGRTEGDEEIQDLLKGSQGLNIGLHFLSGAVNYDPVVTQVDAETASKIVWLDAFITNIDRSFRNTNMLLWHKELWLIDHGASFYFHHSWTNWEKLATTPFSLIKDHVLLPNASALDMVDTRFRSLLEKDGLREIVDSIPDQWLQWEGSSENSQQIKEVYFKFLKLRLANSEIFVKQAQDARKIFI